MISFQLTVSVLCLFMTLSWAHIFPVEANLKVMTLKPSTDHPINSVTQNFSLECAFNSRVKPWQTSMTQILRIRIFKSDSNDRWELMAEITQEKDDVRLYDNVLGRGQVKGDMWTSYLNITWPIVTATTFGKYQCDVLGYNTNNDYMLEKSNSVKLADCQKETEEAFDRFHHVLDREVELIDEKFKLMDASIIYDKEDMENKVNDLSNTLTTLNESLGQNLQSSHEKFSSLKSTDEKFTGLISTLNKSLENTLQSMDEKYNSLKSTDEKFRDLISTLTESLERKAQSMEEKISHVKEQLSTLKKSVHYNYQPWPEGEYGLLEPLTGCPRHLRNGYHKLHTESGKIRNQNEVSSPSHLLPYTLSSEGGKHYVTLNFCTKVVSTSDISWPTGSYCINNRGGWGTCPPGFDYGHIDMDLEDTDTNNSYGGYPACCHPSSSSDYISGYCCRSDGPATTPIDLPSADPFYLYRFKGTCQSVTNMQVSNEYIIIDTEDTRNADSYNYDIYPDSSLNPVRLELCYYTHK